MSSPRGITTSFRVTFILWGAAAPQPPLERRSFRYHIVQWEIFFTIFFNADREQPDAFDNSLDGFILLIL